MGIQVTILGSNSAIPTANRRPTAQIVSVNNEFFLVDCGEGAQIQMRKFGIKFQRISRIFISHMHGDHYFGLIGLLNSMHLLTREKELHIHGPKGLRGVIEIQLNVANSKLRYPLFFHEINTQEDTLIFENDKVSVTSTPVQHRISCTGFVFTEKPKEPGIRKEAIDLFNLSLEDILTIKKGEAIYNSNGEEIDRKLLLNSPTPTKTYAFITDTKPSESYLNAITSADLLYHEATFGNDQVKRARETFHSTAQQAGEIAKKCQVKKLIIGHFSTRYKNLDNLLKEAQKVFENCELAAEGKTFEV